MPTSYHIPPRLTVVARFLSFWYGHIARARRALYEKGLIKKKQLPCPVISVGNITTGGTGKTPLTIFLAALMQSSGLTPLVLSRGYRGRMSATGGVVSDGRAHLMTADQSGDEPLMMARSLPGVPVVIGKNRYQAAMAVFEQFRPHVIILDDGFQHFQLARDINIVLLDNTRPLGNGCLLPAGHLREPVSCLQYADVVVFTRTLSASGYRPAELTGYLDDRQVFTARHVPAVSRWIKAGHTEHLLPERAESYDLSGRRTFAFCGLADNPAFLTGLEHLNAHIAGYLFFRDHHFYSSGNLASIADQAGSAGADLLATSEKDLIKIESLGLLPLPFDLVVVDVTFFFNEETPSFETFIKSRIANIREQ